MATHVLSPLWSIFCAITTILGFIRAPVDQVTCIDSMCNVTISMATARMDFTIPGPGVLLMARGQRINVLGKTPNSWWFGQTEPDGKRGFFRKGQVREITLPSLEPQFNVNLEDLPKTESTATNNTLQIHNPGFEHTTIEEETNDVEFEDMEDTNHELLKAETNRNTLVVDGVVLHAPSMKTSSIPASVDQDLSISLLSDNSNTESALELNQSRMKSAESDPSIVKQPTLEYSSMQLSESDPVDDEQSGFWESWFGTLSFAIMVPNGTTNAVHSEQRKNDSDKQQKIADLPMQILEVELPSNISHNCDDSTELAATTDTVPTFLCMKPDAEQLHISGPFNGTLIGGILRAINGVHSLMDPGLWQAVHAVPKLLQPLAYRDPIGLTPSRYLASFILCNCMIVFGFYMAWKRGINDYEEKIFEMEGNYNNLQQKFKFNKRAHKLKEASLRKDLKEKDELLRTLEESNISYSKSLEIKERELKNINSVLETDKKNENLMEDICAVRKFQETAEKKEGFDQRNELGSNVEGSMVSTSKAEEEIVAIREKNEQLQKELEESKTEIKSLMESNKKAIYDICMKNKNLENEFKKKIDEAGELRRVLSEFQREKAHLINRHVMPMPPQGLPHLMRQRQPMGPPCAMGQQDGIPHSNMCPHLPVHGCYNQPGLDIRPVVGMWYPMWTSHGTTTYLWYDIIKRIQPASTTTATKATPACC